MLPMLWWSICWAAFQYCLMDTSSSSPPCMLQIEPCSPSCRTCTIASAAWSTLHLHEIKIIVWLIYICVYFWGQFTFAFVYRPNIVCEHHCQSRTWRGLGVVASAWIRGKRSRTWCRRLCCSIGAKHKNKGRFELCSVFKVSDEVTPKLWVNPTMPCLLAAYEGRPQYRFRPAIDATLIITPPCPPWVLLIYSIAAKVEFITPICV